MDSQTIAILVLALLVVIGFWLAAFYRRKFKEKQGKARALGIALAQGEMCQVLGTFAMLQDYEQVITLSTTSQQSSLDLIGVKEDSVDFIEFKKMGANLTVSERKIKSLIDQKKVNYIIKDVELPEFGIADRKLKAKSATVRSK